MKLIEPTPKSAHKTGIGKLIHQLQHKLPLAKPAAQPADAIVARLQRGLDNRFIMLRNLHLEHLGPPFPPILVGPCGVAVLNMSHERGLFRAKEDTWWKMEPSSDRFSPRHPNLIRQTQDYASRLATVLDIRGKPHPEITPVLVFTDPGVHIESLNPAVRIVLMDGIDSLINGWLTSNAVLQPVEAYQLAVTLSDIADSDQATPASEGEALIGQDLPVPEKKAPPRKPAISIPRELPLHPVSEKLRFSTMQWLVLGVLLLLTILVLLVAILYALSIL